jgi:catechol-2,3-dioxygenase
MIKPSRLGHLVIRVRDLERSEEFYTQVLGLEVNGRAGDSMVFFRSNPDVDHDLAIMKISSGAPPPEPDRVGLYHFAYELGSIEEIKVAYQVVQDKGVRVAGFGDHGNTKGLYILDPDGIEIELYAVAPECEGIPLQEILTSIAV